MGGSGTIRAFFALELAAGARRRAAGLIAALRGTRGDDVRWVRAETLHVTLRFLGTTDPAVIGDLVREVAEATRDVAPFALRLGAIEVFPTRRPRVVALGLAPEAPLRTLAAAVERGVVAAGFPAETRPFRPHVTLGRARRDHRIRLDAAAIRSVTASVTATDDASDVTDTVLFRSDPTSEGAHYTPLERVPLGAPGGPLHP